MLKHLRPGPLTRQSVEELQRLVQRLETLLPGSGGVTVAAPLTRRQTNSGVHIALDTSGLGSVNGPLVYGTTTVNVSAGTNDLPLPNTPEAYLNVTADSQLTGIAAGQPGQVLVLVNLPSSTNNLVLPSGSASSMAANRFSFPGGSGIVLPPGSATAVQYVGSPTSRWVSNWPPVNAIPQPPTAQTGTSYTLTADLIGRPTTQSNASASTWTLPAPGTLFQAGWWMPFLNLGAGILTLTPGGGTTINGAATLPIVQNQGGTLWTDGSNWFAEYGGGGGAGNSGQATINGYTFSGISGSYADTGLSVTLPVAGTYQLDCNVTGSLVNSGVTNNTFIVVKLFDSTVGVSADVPNTVREVCAAFTASQRVDQAATISVLYTTTGANHTIRLYGQFVYTTLPTSATLGDGSGSGGKVSLAYTLLYTAQPGASPTGAAGGDLGSSYPSPNVTGLQGHPVSNTAPSDGNALTWSAADGQWEPQPRDLLRVGGGPPSPSLGDQGDFYLDETTGIFWQFQ